jgi:hypothetical protein
MLVLLALQSIHDRMNGIPDHPTFSTYQLLPRTPVLNSTLKVIRRKVLLHWCTRWYRRSALWFLTHQINERRIMAGILARTVTGYAR